MARYFNTTGPCMPHMHYMLPPADRLIGASLDRYIRDQLYWVLHAPRQTGKTTFLLSWMREINSGTEAIACYVSVERCQGVPEAEIAIPAICARFGNRPTEEKADYTEAFPHLLLMIDYGGRRNIIEIKLVHPADGRNTPLDEGREQTARYDNKIGADTLHLVIFDRRPEYRAKPWEERLAREAHPTAAGKPVAVIWC